MDNDNDWVPNNEELTSTTEEEVSSAEEEFCPTTTSRTKTSRKQQLMEKIPHLVAVSAADEIAGPSTSSHSFQTANIIDIGRSSKMIKSERVTQEIEESKAAVAAIEVQEPIDLDDFEAPPLKIAKKEILLEVGGAGAQCPFDPVDYELDATFRLTKYVDMKERGGKVPQDALKKFLEGFQKDHDSVTFQQEQELNQQNLSAPKIGMDVSVTPLRHPGLCLVQTTDVIYSMVDDPYMLGKIACANVLSDLYAIGVTDCDNMLMLLSVSTKLTDKERDVVIPLMMRGFKDMAAHAGTIVTGGHTAINPWIAIGGVASAICQAPEFLNPENALPGDVLVLTKPLGTQIAASAHHWLSVPDKWNRIKLVISDSEVRKAYNRALDVMARLNRNAARLMHKYNAHGATDVTGYGLLGHANNLAKNQKEEVAFVIHNLPVIAKMIGVAKACGNMFQLLQGHCVETSGGLLIILPRQEAANFCKEIEKQEGYQAWIIGIVEKGNRTARIIDKPRVIEVPSKEKEGSLW